MISLQHIPEDGAQWPLIFSLVLRPSWVRSASRSMNPYIVCFVVIAVVAILAVTTGLLVYFLALGPKDYFYRSSFQILNVQYTDELSSPNTQKYRSLSEKIESEITQTFKKSNLRKQFIRAHVVRLRQNGSDVIGDIVMKFKFARNSNEPSVKRKIESVLRQMLNKPGNLAMNTIDLTQITHQDTEDILTQECGVRPDLISLSDERIIGGTKAKEGDWPWQVSLQWNNLHHCGGVFISKEWILTAAHCFRSRSDTLQWTVTFGISTKFPKERRGVRTILIHNNYKPETHENDIALLQLDREVTFTRNIRTVCLPDASQNILPGSRTYVTGWGSQRYSGSPVPDLQQAQVNIISNNVCNAPSSYNGAILPGMLCAGLSQGGVDACQGDSGGPLVQEDARRLWFLVGIVSWGDQCALPDKPGVYTLVTAYREWINQHAGI
ncbi:transmembrane protease serine 11D-like [Neophocaena asiaeorientalis asiaeorientalis]|uniref:Transmembrane protease serine n=1 Tax=Neophocaena asiaeorientalis asiaeorientalis TaxID=1706337 RepID=A0A341B3J0_NEOAA|nr:transmembrane protease serine 11D-like [Neophocaena asiaeorientalis asiaeorientalis]